MGLPEHCVPERATVCLSCANLMDDLQDPSIIESAVSCGGHCSGSDVSVAQRVGAVDGSGCIHRLVAA